MAIEVNLRRDTMIDLSPDDTPINGRQAAGMIAPQAASIFVACDAMIAAYQAV